MITRDINSFFDCGSVFFFATTGIQRIMSHVIAENIDSDCRKYLLEMNPYGKAGDVLDSYWTAVHKIYLPRGKSFYDSEYRSFNKKVKSEKSFEWLRRITNSIVVIGQDVHIPYQIIVDAIKPRRVYKFDEGSGSFINPHTLKSPFYRIIGKYILDKLWLRYGILNYKGINCMYNDGWFSLRPDLVEKVKLKKSQKVHDISILVAESNYLRLMDQKLGSFKGDILVATQPLYETARFSAAEARTFWFKLLAEISKTGLSAVIKMHPRETMRDEQFYITISEQYTNVTVLKRDADIAAELLGRRFRYFVTYTTSSLAWVSILIPNTKCISVQSRFEELSEVRHLFDSKVQFCHVDELVVKLKEKN